jgi:dTDP-4-dehydrorhamnose reductase
MKLLITGAGGLLGLNLALESRRTHEVIGLDRGALRKLPFELLRLELTEAGAFEQALSVSRADAVIHCAAMADVDACERHPEAARRINTNVPARIARACHGSGVRLVHISTDAVFDGTASVPYSEADDPNPTSVYARTKLDAEAEVLAAYTSALVVRVNFYGWSPTGKRSLAEFFVNNLAAGSQVRGFTDVTFCPMLVTDLGALILRMLDSGLSGLYHAVGPEPMTKYDFGVAIAREFGFSAGQIVPTSVEAADLAARRAHNLALSIDKLSTVLPQAIPDFSTGLRRFHQQFVDGYPQMIRSYQQPIPARAARSAD